MKKENSFWLVLIVFAIGFLFGYFLARNYQEEPKEIIKTVVKYEKSDADSSTAAMLAVNWCIFIIPFILVRFCGC